MKTLTTLTLTLLLPVSFISHILRFARSWSTSFLLILAVCVLGRLSLVADTDKKTNRLLNYTIQYPEELNAPFSLDDPPCKTFTEEQKQHQIAEGQRILAEILAAEKAGKDEYVIPAGDYRFIQKSTPKSRTAGFTSFYLNGIKRPDDRPFAIIGKGVTFWTPPTDNGRGSSIYLNECENIAIVGITVDSDSPNDFEGRLAAVNGRTTALSWSCFQGR